MSEEEVTEKDVDYMIKLEVTEVEFELLEEVLYMRTSSSSDEEEVDSICALLNRLRDQKDKPDEDTI